MNNFPFCHTKPNPHLNVKQVNEITREILTDILNNCGTMTFCDDSSVQHKIHQMTGIINKKTLNTENCHIIASPGIIKKYLNKEIILSEFNLVEQQPSIYTCSWFSDAILICSQSDNNNFGYFYDLNTKRKSMSVNGSRYYGKIKLL